MVTLVLNRVLVSDISREIEAKVIFRALFVASLTSAFDISEEQC